MTRIDGAQRLAVLLRTEAAALRARAAPGVPAQAAARQPASSAAARLAAPRIRAIAPDDPQRKQKAVRVFLETVFARELGGSLVQDPAFARMVEAVQEQMQGDRELGAMVDAAGEALLAAAAATPNLLRRGREPSP